MIPFRPGAGRDKQRRWLHAQLRSGCGLTICELIKEKALTRQVAALVHRTDGSLQKEFGLLDCKLPSQFLQFSVLIFEIGASLLG
jgi:hypothetical protein